MDEKVAHLVLARKYRPQKFGDVVQQQTAVRALQNAIEGDRLGSAYLFFGPRGIGKTTIARILAKRVNCKNPQDGEPCDECESCETILSGNSLDVMEIDAASHRGIHHIRELRENVKFQPMVSHKKVYIIDEVHMLTTESFNALLKTLEEPPPHVMFILATTELNKIPETVLSRCQVFNFKKVQLSVLQGYLSQLCSAEGIEAEEEALFWIARRGDGSVRDSLSFLEQAITYSGGKLTTEKVKELIGTLPTELFTGITHALLDSEGNPATILEPVHEIFSGGSDLMRFIWEYLDFLRIAIQVHHGIDNPEFLGIPQSEIKSLGEAFQDVDGAALEFVFQSLYKTLGKANAMRLRNSYESRVLIEMELLALHSKLKRPSISGVLNRLNKLSASMKGGGDYDPEFELQKQFLGTVVDPDQVPTLEGHDEPV